MGNIKKMKLYFCAKPYLIFRINKKVMFKKLNSEKGSIIIEFIELTLHSK